MGLFRRNREERALPPGALTLGGSPWSPRTSAGERVDADTALRHPAVWSCVHLIAGTISSFPVDVYADGEHVDAPAVLEEPAAGMTLGDFVYAVVQSLLLHANTVGLVTARSGANLLPTQVELVAFPRVSLSLDPNDGSVTVRIGGESYDYLTDVWHVAGYRTAGAVLGLSPVQHGAEVIALGLAQVRFAAEYFGAGAGGIPVGVLKPSPGAQWDQGNVDGEGGTAETLVDQWRQYRSRRTGVVVLNQVDFEPLEFDANAMQLVEAQQENVRAVCRLFNVPPEMIASEAAGSLTYSNVEMRNRDFLQFTLGPWIRAVEAGLSQLLPRNQRAKFNVDALLRATTLDRYKAHQLGIEAGFLTVNEARDLEDLPPLPAASAASASPSPGNGQQARPQAMEPMR